MIDKANKKLKIKGALLVLDENGTPVHESDILKLCATKLLILLQEKEVWQPSSMFTQHNPSNHTSNEEDHTSNVEGSKNNVNSNESVSSNDETEKNNDASHVHDLENTTNSNTLSDTENISGWNNFSIPWQKMKSETMTGLGNGKKSKRIRFDVVAVVVDALRTINIHIPEGV